MDFINLPNYQESSKKGEDGITIIKSIVEKELNWIFRVNHKEFDFGIDAYLDIITELGQVTGKAVAVQVKTGSSYFKEMNDLGWIFRGEMSHLNYYLNHDIPVVIIIVNEKLGKAYWCLCDPFKTEKTEKNWKITIPFKKELNSHSKSELLEYISPIKDYASQLEYFWQMNKTLMQSGRIIFMVDRADIENSIYDELIIGFDRLKTNEGLILNTREKIDIAVHGYNEDPRELYEISEFRVWVQNIFNRINGWTYFLAKDKNAQFLRLIQLCHTEVEIVGRHINGYVFSRPKVEVNLETGVTLLEQLFDDLNVFCEKFGISDEVNMEISDNLMVYLVNDPEWKANSTL